MTSRVWYLVAGGFVATSLTIAALGFTTMLSAVEGMYRVAMPGKADVMLPAGPSTLYAESESQLEGKVYVHRSELTFRCGVTDAAGRAVEQEKSTTGEHYEAPGYAGHAAFELSVPAPGTYVLQCEAAEPFVMAIGRGVGTWRVIALVALIPALAGVIVMVIVFVKRRRQRGRAA